MDQYADYVVYHKRIREVVVPDKRLGRHVRHDSRSMLYRYQSVAPKAGLKTNLIERYIAILNQGQTSSCTANAFVGALGSGALFNALAPVQRNELNEPQALYFYNQEEQILYGSGYPPTDNGGDGLTIATVGKNDGYISGYTHCTDLNGVLAAINDGNSVMIGSNWYDSMDAPDSNGLVSISPNASVRGGHEYLARGINVESQLILLDNSWSDGWGDKGSFFYSWDTLERLLAEQGDATVPIALSQPAPVPAIVGWMGEHGPELLPLNFGDSVVTS